MYFGNKYPSASKPRIITRMVISNRYVISRANMAYAGFVDVTLILSLGVDFGGAADMPKVRERAKRKRGIRQPAEPLFQFLNPVS